MLNIPEESDKAKDQSTYFGFQKILESEKTKKVSGVFNSVSTKYDLMNDILSCGIHRFWKRITIEMSGIRQDDKVLDIASGTGDLAYSFSKLVGRKGEIVLLDINLSMLKIARDRLLDKGVSGKISIIQADAESLPFPDNYYDCITIAFGLRNITRKEKALRSILRVLKPGGRLLILEFSKPESKLISTFYDMYSFSFMPLIGKIVLNDKESYKYLAESIRMHPDQETLKTMMLNIGYKSVTYHNMSLGIVALHRGMKTYVS